MSDCQVGERLPPPVLLTFRGPEFGAGVVAKRLARLLRIAQRLELGHSPLSLFRFATGGELDGNGKLQAQAGGVLAN